MFVDGRAPYVPPPPPPPPPPTPPELTKADPAAANAAIEQMTPVQATQLKSDVEQMPIGDRTDFVNDLATKLEAPQLVKIEGVFGQETVANAVETRSPPAVRDEYAALSTGKPTDTPPTNGTTQTTERIGANSVTWTNDSQGRPIHVEADLSEVFDGIDRSSAETDAQRDAADRGIEGDQGGHVIGHRFVKDQGLKNLFPQNGNFNVSAYKTLENEWADWIDSGKEVRITVDLTPANVDRPDKVRVSYEVVDPANGSVVYDQRVTFRNEADQTFDRVPRGDMDKY